MAKCPVYVPMKAQPGKKSERYRVCGCGVTGFDGSVFYKVQYSELHYHHERSGKFEDVIPICRRHAKEYSAPTPWNAKAGYRHAICGLRGIVGTIAPVDPSLMPSQMQEKFRSDERETICSEIKGSIKRIMEQKNVTDIKPSEWEKIFNDCVLEFTVERVMNS